MRVIEHTVYKFNELSEEAKENARSWYRQSNNHEYLYKEIRDVLDAAEKHFRFRAYAWRYCEHVCTTRIDCDCIDTEDVSVKDWILSRIPEEDCPFTGVCYDETFLDALRNADYDQPIERIFHDAVIALFQGAIEEMEYQNEDAQVGESIIANDYEFYETGKIV